MIKKLKVAAIALLALGFSATAQEKFPAGSKGTLPAPILVPSIADQIKNGTVKYADNTPQLGHPKGKSGNNVVPGKGALEGPDPLIELQRNTVQTQMRAPNLIFTADISQATPSDPTGAAGVNQYMAAWNSAFRIFDKDGNPESAELALGTIFPGNNIGDPIIFFDAEAENGDGEPRGRFVITEFDNNPNGFNVAVSTGPDAMTSAWHVYTTGFGTGQFPDYTKFSVWGDSYIVTANVNNGANGDRVFAVERNEMLQGNPAQFVGFPLPGIATNGFYSPQGFHITDDQHPADGTPAPIIYMQDDAWAGVTEDHLQIWEATIDWANPANHGIVSAQEIGPAEGLTPFVSVFDGGSFSNRPQPGGPDLDVLQATVMNQVQYRRFGTHNSVVLNFVINDNVNQAELAVIRWYELRQPTGDDTEDWEIYQEGTYVAPDRRDAYSGSMVMNTEGDIALAYSSSSATDMISIRYTGRRDGDPLNIMTASEQLIAQSTGANPSNRFADYVQLTNDPVDDSFWHIAEYFEPTRRDVVANFELLDPLGNDISPFSIDSPPLEGDFSDGMTTISASIRNFGSNDITDPTVQYTIDGGDPVIQTFTGLIIEAGLTESVTFAQTADLSEPGQMFDIVVTTLLDGDENTNNDSTTCTVLNTDGALCMPNTTGGCNVDGIKMFVLGTISADDGGNGCNTEPAGGPVGYADRRNLSTDLSRSEGENVHLMQIQQNWNGSVGVSAVSAWVDFNDDGIFEPSEQLITEDFFEVFLELDDFDLVIPTDAALGSHTLRVRSIDTSGAGDINDPCGDVQFGETQDYTVNIVETLSVDDNVFSQTSINISTNDNNNFAINISTPFEGRGAITVFNLLGQRLTYNNLKKEGNEYNYDLDMSYASAGVYIVQFIDIDKGSSVSKKIVVK